MSEPLTGAALIAKVKEMPGASKSELVRACGYVSAKKDGREYFRFTAFYEAFAVALGAPAQLAERKAKDPDRETAQRPLPYVTTVITTGAVVIGNRYIQQLGLRRGDKLSIEISGGRLSITPMGADAA